jgi:tRNA(Ile)-lysidine synthase
MRLSERVLGAIRRHELVPPGGRVVVALSGGSDSVALLLLLRELQASGELDVVAAAHLNHGLRESAHHDEQFCRALAGGFGIPFRADLIDVRARAARDRTSVEDAGREARYELFDRVAGEFRADAVATGHTRDDQAETFLLRLLRGAGPRGLSGIHPKVRLPAEAPKARRWVIRPVLDCSRDDLREYLAARGQPFCEDESNADLSIPRNRVRHELLPLLRERYSPAIADVLARDAAIARADDDRLQREAIDLARSIVLPNRATESGTPIREVELDVVALAALHPALAVRVARIALQELTPDRFVGFDHVEGLLELVRSDGSKHASLSLPGQYAERRGSRIVLSREPFKPYSNSFRVPLSIPGEVILTEQGWAVSAHVGSDPTLGSDPKVRSFRNVLGSDPKAFSAFAQRVSGGLAVRSRQPGDWLRPLGMGGRRKKLQDVLVDRKVARDRRDSIPIVVDETDRIVWVVGEAVTEDFRVTEPSQAVIFLKARRLGGQG